jgi:hypothetical protein
MDALGITDFSPAITAAVSLTHYGHANLLEEAARRASPLCMQASKDSFDPCSVGQRLEAPVALRYNLGLTPISRFQASS